MKLLTMKLENFQAIGNLTLDFNGLNKTIRGNNGTGKTTVANAQSWLLTGKSSADEKNYSPKTQDASGLDHSVECSYSLDDGRVVTLKKTLREKYTKKRGSTTAEFSGHEVLHYIDDVPVKEKEYQDFLVGCCGVTEEIQMMTNVSYFAETMKWDKRRKLLLDMCGDYSDDYIIASNPELLDLKTILLKPGNADQFYTVEEYMKLTKEQMKKINTEINAIPARIDEANRAIPEIIGEKEEMQNKINELKEGYEKLNAKKVSLMSNDTEKMKQDKIREIQNKIAIARVEHQATYSAITTEIQDKINKLSSEVNDIRMNISSKDRSIANCQKDIRYMNDRRDFLIEEYNKKRAEYKEVQSQSWDESKEICPTCGQPLPYDKVEELKAKFNLQKSQKLEAIANEANEINRKGKEVSADAIKEVEDLIAKLEKEKEVLGTDLILKNQAIQSLEKEKPVKIPFESTNAYVLYKTELEVVNSESVDNESKEELARIDEQIDAILVSQKQLQEEISKFSIKDFQLERIKTLKEMQRHLCAKYENHERSIYLCEQFIKTKVSMVTEKINECFKEISFKLFDIQVNGGLKECCEIMIPSPAGVNVPYASANNAAKINAGLEVIETLQRHFNVTLPVFVDNAESVTELKNINTQMIRLVVDANHNKLFMED